jgi:hypothetical protein
MLKEPLASIHERVRREDASAPTPLGTPFVSIFQSVMQGIAAQADLWGEREFGCPLFGLYSRGRRPMVFFAAGPGEHASHGTAFFREDPEFFRRAVEGIEGNYGFQYIGHVHSHHSLGLNSLSGVDIDQVHSMAESIHPDIWFSLLLTSEHLETGAPPFSPSIAFHAFVFEDPVHGQPIPCPIRVLPGISPLQLALEADEREDLCGVDGFASHVSMERITYDAMDTNCLSGDVTKDIPEGIVDQLRQLAAKGSNEGELDLVIGDREVVVTLPLGEGMSAEVGVAWDSPHRICTAKLRRADSSVSDVTEEVSSRTERLRLVYLRETLLALMEDETSARPVPAQDASHAQAVRVADTQGDPAHSTTRRIDRKV